MAETINNELMSGFVWDILFLCIAWSFAAEKRTMKLRPAGGRWGCSVCSSWGKKCVRSVFECVCGDSNEDRTGTTWKCTCMCIYVCMGLYMRVCPAWANVHPGVYQCFVFLLKPCDGCQSNARGRKGLERRQTQTWPLTTMCLIST